MPLIEKAEDPVQNVQDEDEIDLDDGDDDDGGGDGDNGDGDNGVAGGADTTFTTSTADVTGDKNDASPNSNSNTNKSKKSKLQERLRKLQLKINQSKKLNHQEVVQEGERLCSREAYNKHMKQTHKNDAKAVQKEAWENVHEKNVKTLLLASGSGDGNGDDSGSGSSGGGKNSNKKNVVIGNKDDKKVKALMQSGSESLRQSHKKSEKEEQNLFSTNDFYNPEGQFRNYERSLKSISKGTLRSGSSSSAAAAAAAQEDGYNNDTMEHRQFQRERNGAKRLANELKRRASKAEKRKQKDRMDFEASDITSINKRNKHFNEKISRNYDKHTAEIRQNLERGTAL